MSVPHLLRHAGAAVALAWLGTTAAPGRALGAQALDGTFPLVTVDGRPLPARTFEIPTRDGRGTGCYAVVSSGWLTLDARAGTFSMGARVRDSCGVTVVSLGDTSAAGRYLQGGGRPELSVQPVDSPRQVIPTRIAGDTLEVYDTYTHRRYAYRLARRSPARRPAGRTRGAA